jgi:hypothetical protein
MGRRARFDCVCEGKVGTPTVGAGWREPEARLEVSTRKLSGRRIDEPTMDAGWRETETGLEVPARRLTDRGGARLLASTMASEVAGCKTRDAARRLLALSNAVIWGEAAKTLPPEEVFKGQRGRNRTLHPSVPLGDDKLPIFMSINRRQALVLALRGALNFSSC